MTTLLTELRLCLCVCLCRLTMRLAPKHHQEGHLLVAGIRSGLLAVTRWQAVEMREKGKK